MGVLDQRLCVLRGSPLHGEHLVLKRIGIVWALREEDPLQLRRSERVAGRRIVCTAAHGAVAERDRDRLFI
jgi:hypothetical protein